MAGVCIFSKKINLQSGIKGQLVKLCQLATVVQNKQETKMFCVYRLIAAIAEILKTYEGIDEAMGNDRLEKMRINAIYNKLQHLSQIHYFVEPIDVKERKGTISDESVSGARRTKDKRSSRKMAISLYEWIREFQTVSKVTPYCIDRIFTRFYNNLNEIVPDGWVENAEIGHCMNKFVLCLWNACFVEDAIVRGELEGMTLDCNEGIEEAFLSNYWAILKTLGNGMDLPADCLSAWMFQCPLLQCYADPYIMAMAQKGEENFPITLYEYSMYKQKSIKENIVKRNNSMILSLSNRIDEILKKLNSINSLSDVERTITIKKMEIESGNRSVEQIMKANDELKALENQKLMLIKYAYYDERELYAQLQKLHESKDTLEEQNVKLTTELDKNDSTKDLSKSVRDKLKLFVEDAGFGNNIPNVMEDLGCTD